MARILPVSISTITADTVVVPISIASPAATTLADFSNTSYTNTCSLFWAMTHCTSKSLARSTSGSSIKVENGSSIFSMPVTACRALVSRSLSGMVSSRVGTSIFRSMIRMLLPRVRSASARCSMQSSKILISWGELKSATFMRLRYADAISGTMTCTSPATVLQQARRQPSAHSSSLIWRVFLESSSPPSSFTRHFPQEPLPEQGASMTTLDFRAVSSRFSPAIVETVTFSPFSNWNTTFAIYIFLLTSSLS